MAGVDGCDPTFGAVIGPTSKGVAAEQVFVDANALKTFALCHRQTSALVRRTACNMWRPESNWEVRDEWGRATKAVGFI